MDYTAEMTPEKQEDWCAVDGCPAAICGGPHIEVRTDFGIELLRPDQEPVGARLTAWDQNVCAEGHPRATDWAGGPERCIRGHQVVEHPIIEAP